MRKAVLVIACLAGLAGLTYDPAVAAAQPGLMEEPPPAAPAAMPADLRSERTALVLSLAGTGASWGLMVAGAYAGPRAEGLATIGAISSFVTPSLGHWYAGSILTRGMGIRAASLLPAFVGTIGLALGDPDIGAGLLISAGVLYAAGTIDDILSAPRKARRHNQRRAGVAVAPLVTHHSAGVALGGRF